MLIKLGLGGKFIGDECESEMLLSVVCMAPTAISIGDTAWV